MLEGMPVKSLCLKENPSESVRFRRIFVKKRAIAQQKLFANATAPYFNALEYLVSSFKF